MPTHLGSLTLRVASVKTKVQIPSERHIQIMIFINSESYLTEKEVQELQCMSIHILL